MYSQVETGAVTRVNISLPATIGGVHIPAGAEGLESFGLYEQISIVPDFDQKSQRLTGPVYAFTGRAVELVYSVEDIPQEEFIQAERAQVFAQIAALESRQPRAVREMLLGVEGAKERLQAIEDQISGLREQL